MLIKMFMNIFFFWGLIFFSHHSFLFSNSVCPLTIFFLGILNVWPNDLNVNYKAFYEWEDFGLLVMIHASKLSIQTCFSLHLRSDHHGYAERKISSVAALEIQNPSEKTGTAITGPATKHTQEVCARWMILFLSNTLSRYPHKPPAQVIMPYSVDALLFWARIALVCVMWAYYSDIWFNIIVLTPVFALHYSFISFCLHLTTWFWTAKFVTATAS